MEQECKRYRLAIKNGILFLPQELAEKFNNQVLYVFRTKPNGCTIATELYYKKVAKQIETFSIEKSRTLQRYMFGNGNKTFLENNSICIEEMLLGQKTNHVIGTCSDDYIDMEW